MPYSLRPLPKTRDEHVLNNEFTLLSYTLPLRKQFCDAVALLRKNTHKMKTSLFPFAIHTVAQVIACMPAILGLIAGHWVMNKATMIVSNVPGPKTPLVYNGVKVVGFIAMIPGIGEMAFGVSAMSMADRLYMAFQADKSLIEDAQELKEIVERNYDELSVAATKSP